MTKKKPEKDEKPENAGEVQEIERDEKGRFPKGVSGNPAGKPLGTKHLSTQLFNELQKEAKGQGKTYAELLVQRVLSDAIVKGKGDMIKLIYQYIDGAPLQGIDLTTGGDKLGSAGEDEIMKMAAEISAKLKESET